MDIFRGIFLSLLITFVVVGGNWGYERYVKNPQSKTGRMKNSSQKIIARQKVSRNPYYVKYGCDESTSFHLPKGREEEALNRLSNSFVRLQKDHQVKDERSVIIQYNDYTMFVVEKALNSFGFCIRAGYPISAGDKKFQTHDCLGALRRKKLSDYLGGCCCRTPLGLHRVASILGKDAGPYDVLKSGQVMDITVEVRGALNVIIQYNGKSSSYRLTPQSINNVNVPGFEKEGALALKVDDSKNIFYPKNGTWANLSIGRNQFRLQAISDMRNLNYLSKWLITAGYIRLTGISKKARYSGYNRKDRSCYQGAYNRGVVIHGTPEWGNVGNRHRSRGCPMLKGDDMLALKRLLKSGNVCGRKRIRRYCGKRRRRTVKKFCNGTPVFITRGGPPVVEE